MADEKAEADGSKSDNPEPQPAEKKRDIKGNLPYSTSPGTFKKSLESLIQAERPDRFSGDFMSTVLKVSGGSARPIPPMLKKMQFLSSDGSPTELYSKFKTDSGRGFAAFEGLKNAFSEIFRRNEFAHKATEAEIKDIIVEITGLKKSDNIVRLISQTFEAIRSFVGEVAISPPDVQKGKKDIKDEAGSRDNPARKSDIGLSYQINIILPETENIAVFNAIFKSLRENLL